MSELTQIDVRAEALWQSKTVTTDAPRLVPHQEWSLEVRLHAGEPLRAAVLVESATERSWGLVHQPPSESLTLRVRFAPDSWSSSDDVHIGFEWRHIWVTDKDLKLDPGQHVTVELPRVIRTGQVTRVCAVPKHNVWLGVLPFAARDTQSRRQGRWRVRPSLAAQLPQDHRFVLDGHQAGITPR